MTSTTIRNPAQRKKVEGKDDRDSSNASADHEKQQPSKKPTIVTFPEQVSSSFHHSLSQLSGVVHRISQVTAFSLPLR